MEYRLLGPLEVGDGQGETLHLGGAKQRALLAILLLHPNEVVPADRLIDDLWGEDPPETAGNVLQVYIGHLRRALQPDRIQGTPSDLIITRHRGYMLRVAAEELDVERCQRLVEQGRAVLSADPNAAAQLLREALGLWRGQPLADVAFASVRGEAARLDELRCTALEVRIEADLSRGVHAELVGELEALATRHPLRERLRAHWMLALYRSGRQADALAVYRETKRLLGDELGIDPAPELQKLELSILRHDPLIAAPMAETRTPPRPVLDPTSHLAKSTDLCASCGQATQSMEELCSRCAALVETAITPREERKIVTVLYADLVTITAGPRPDPEDVGPFLSPYFARLRAELERCGGVVETFMGDSLMALFGAPISHEDDPERAVRAALAIRDWVLEDDKLQVRVAIDTGEALVRLGAGLTESQQVAAGDVINTTARLHAAAPANKVLVGEITYRATSQVITYRAAEQVAVRGMTASVSAWEAVEARSRFGVDLASARRAPLVGRTHELSVLTDALMRVRRDLSPQLVTLAGVPGIGKSRLVSELFRAVDETPELIYWRQGRSLPYGDGVTFWALGEMVKAQAGILETDSPERAEEKLEAAIAEVILERADAQWAMGHLRPLAGLSNDSEAGSDRREEAFTAWRRFFEALAEKGPLVLVFEDLHWADDNLLDFVEHLIDWASGVPILVVCSVRPELFERRPGWGGGTRNSTTLWLAPLSEGETAQLISSLSERPVMAAKTQQALLTRAGGNPLYAEQYVRMLEERGDAEELPLPETVQGIIAARLDGLPAEEKHLLQSAAVLGKVFWVGALTRGGDADRRAIERDLHSLERKDFVQRVRRSSVAAEAEYAFLHVLVRDVAYRQIPRARRAEQHRLAADWIGSLGRTEDHAEMLAHHYLSALDLWSAAGQPVDSAFARRALSSLAEAGDRALSLNAYTSAVGFYQSALELVLPGSPERAQLLFQLGRTRLVSGDLDPHLLSAASVELVAAGDPERAAEAEAALAELHWLRGDTDRSTRHLARARELVNGRQLSRAKASVTNLSARYLMLSGQSEDAIRLGREALSMAEQLMLDELHAHALITIGGSRVSSGDPAGIEDLEQGLAIALEADVPTAICRAQGNLAAALHTRGHLKRALAMAEDGAETASRFGLAGDRRWFRGDRSGNQYLAGHWDDALAAADEFVAEVEAGSPHYQAAYCYATRAQIRLGRDAVAESRADAERAVKLARLIKDPQCLFHTLAVSADIFRESGATDRAALLADEFLAELKAGRTDSPAIGAVHMLAWTLAALGRGTELNEVLPSSDIPWVQAAAAFAAGELEAAADICGAMGAATDEAHDRLWLAETLISENRRSEADIHLQRALVFYQSVGATRYIRKAKRLLAASA